MSVFEKLKKGVSTAGTKVSAAMEVNRLRMQVSLKKKEIEREFRSIGEAYFANYLKTEKVDIDAVLRPHCENIVAIQRDIQELERKIQKLNHEKKCACGKTVPQQAKYCPFCGRLLEEEKD
jgi:uncharacterized coiled-coil DUF342 family protein